MPNHNITQRGTQETRLGVMFGRCSPDSQHGRPDRHLANIGSTFSGTRITWTREDNQLALHCYFRSKLSQKGRKKRMIEIWQECTSFHITSQRLADQVRTIIKKGWFSHHEILEIHQKTNKKDNNTAPDTSRVVKKNQRKRNELLTSENGNAAQPNNTPQNNPKETLSSRTKGKSRKLKENNEQGKDYFTVIKKNIE